MARQQRFATELVDQVASIGTLANPVQLQRLVGTISTSLQTDDALGAPQLFDLASSLSGLSADGLQTETLPVADDRIDGQAVLVPIPDLAEAAYTPFRDADHAVAQTGVDEAPAEATPTGGVPAEQAPVEGAPVAAAPGSASDAAPQPEFVGAATSEQAC